VDFAKLSSVYFIGIGGIGMSAIARFFLAEGRQVGGYDRTATPLTRELEQEGMQVHYEDAVDGIPTSFRDPASTLVVYTPAVPADHRELAWFREQGFSVMKRSQVLGLITRHCFTIAVAGTHGKTTTSSMVAHLLRSAGIPCTAFLGGITKNYHNNLLIGKPHDGIHYVVVEADEYDRSFLTLYPDIAIITSMDPDHLDIYGTPEEMVRTYRQFAAQVKTGGWVVHRKGLPLPADGRIISYAIREPALISGKDVRISAHRYQFTYSGLGAEWKDLWTRLPGYHNVENAVAAISVARILGLPEDLVRGGLESYTGVLRRFDYQVDTADHVYIDDYAHHPEELRACILSARELYPEKKITGVFQPHLFTRTRDFVEGFAESLSLLDELLLLDIYPARELPIDGVTSRIIYERVTIPAKRIVTKAEVLEIVGKERPEVLLTLGAGDIDQLVEPLRDILLKS
jgi:UDP-N-acetylmuramate--alanine ligase